jgi:DNA polymerase-3 subunit gamma/tau
VETRGGWQPSLALELALAESLEIPAEIVGTNQDPSAGPRRGPKAAPAKPATTSQGSHTNKVDAASDVAKPAGEAGSNPPAVIDLAEIAKAWKDVRAVIKPGHPAVEALLNSCKPMDVRGGELILGFQSDTVRTLMDKPENLEVTGKAIADVLGITVTIKCVVTNAKGKLPPNVSQDGMVAAALNHGGEIVDVQD